VWLDATMLPFAVSFARNERGKALLSARGCDAGLIAGLVSHGVVTLTDEKVRGAGKVMGSTNQARLWCPSDCRPRHSSRLDLASHARRGKVH
jgi:hypothetical protein